MRLPTAEEKRLYYEATGREAPSCKIRRKPRWLLPSKLGFTFARTILLRDGDESAALVVHELVHVRQWIDGGLAFWASYIWQLFTKGYRGIDYEIEAYEAQKRIES